MIISRTPFRISLAGGGTDLESFYREEAGAVVSTAINKYMYVSAHPYFEDRILLKYSRTELVNRASEIRHPLMREAIRLAKIRGGIEMRRLRTSPPEQGLAPRLVLQSVFCTPSMPLRVATSPPNALHVKHAISR